MSDGATRDDGSACRVYISGPVTGGDRNRNVYQAFDAQAWLMRNGFAPLNPIASTCYPFAWQPEYTHEMWLWTDLAWVGVSDCVLRLPGKSPGADREVAFAELKGIPVFDDRASLAVWREKHWGQGRKATASGGYLPDDIADGFESLRLAIQSHRVSGWSDMTPSDLHYLLADLIRVSREPELAANDGA